MIKRHGVIGGPKNKRPIQPRMKPRFHYEGHLPKPKKDSGEIKVFVVSSDETKVDVFEELKIVPEPEEVLIVEPEEEEVVVVEPEIDPVLEEDKDCNPNLECPICLFVSKSEKGLKSHMRWKHSTVGA